MSNMSYSDPGDHNVMQTRSTAFLRVLCCILKSIIHEKTANELVINHAFYYVPVLSSYVFDHAA